ncbi:ubiquitin fusion degradation protein [Dispira parvispora]|uniref:Ubiquitin fusion degradation protein 1 n=1 Tax=Dispira parvispora TaxID=1520584 RepID=A0A9W8ASQ1_9FUNG|nr:ubiquitin fusion degradation protein [Dispira parvispora]
MDFGNFDDMGDENPRGFNFGGWMGGLGPTLSNQQFNEHFRCYSVAMMSGPMRDNVNYGGKVILPPSSLDKLTRLNIMYPMIFTLENESQQRSTHAGVLEFTAEEGRVYLPYWMMQTLAVEPGDILQVKSTSLPLGKFVRIQPQSVDFLDISDPRAVLENALRNFSTLTVGDIITISYNDKQYDILVQEIKPEGPGISIVETDLEVDFAPPVGYIEPERPARGPASLQPTMASELNLPPPGTDAAGHDAQSQGWTAFQGAGNRLSNRGNSKSSSSKTATVPTPSAQSIPATGSTGSSAAPPALNLPFGQLFFGFQVQPPASVETTTTGSSTFAGEGNALKPRRNKPTSGKSTTRSSSSSSKAPASGHRLGDG